MGFPFASAQSETIMSDEVQPRPSASMKFRSKVVPYAWTRVDSLVLVWVRIAVAIAVYVWADDYLSDDKYKILFIDARVLFKYDAMTWVGLWPGDAMRWHFVVTKIAAIGLGVGCLTRLSAMLLCGSIAYVLLVDCQLYINHYYLLSMMAGLLVFLPCGKRWSVDTFIGAERPSTTFRRWQLWLLRFQLGIPYVFGAIAKLNGDWFRGQPADLILRNQTELLGLNFAEVPYVVEIFMVGGFGYDLLVVPMLMWRPTRPIAVGLSLVFHLTNAMTLNIGVFPWFMLATMVVFFPPDTLDRRMRLFLGQPISDEARRSGPVEPGSPSTWRSITTIEKIAVMMALVHVLIQLLLPIRPAIYPGDSNWNERGHRFAWRMMLRNKEALTHFLVVDKNSDDFLFVPSTTVLTGNQSQRADHHPELIRQTAIAISHEAAKLGVPENRVYALALVSLNGRRPTPIVDPTVDLTTVARGWWRDDWVVEDPGPFLDPPWTVPKDQWWQRIELPDPFKTLQGHTPQELQSYLREVNARAGK